WKKPASNLPKPHPSLFTSTTSSIFPSLSRSARSPIKSSSAAILLSCKPSPPNFPLLSARNRSTTSRSTAATSTNSSTSSPASLPITVASMAASVSSATQPFPSAAPNPTPTSISSTVNTISIPAATATFLSLLPSTLSRNSPSFATTTAPNLAVPPVASSTSS